MKEKIEIFIRELEEDNFSRFCTMRSDLCPEEMFTQLLKKSELVSDIILLLKQL